MSSEILKDEELSPRTKSLYAPPPLPPPLPPLPEPLEAEESLTLIAEDKKPPIPETKNTIAYSSPPKTSSPPSNTGNTAPSKPASMSEKIAPAIPPPFPEFSLLPPESIIPISSRSASISSSLPPTTLSSSKLKHLSMGSKTSSGSFLPKSMKVRLVKTAAAIKSDVGASSATDMNSDMNDRDAQVKATAEGATPSGIADNGDLTKTPARQKRVIEPIFFDLQPSPSADSALKARIIQERQKQLERVLRFNTEPAKREDLSISPITETTVLGARRAAVRRGFATGFDTTSPEEERKRNARIKRFGAPEAHPLYKPDEDVHSRVARAERFGPGAIAAATIANQKTLPRVRTLETRRTPDPSEVPRMTAIHLFGVDNLSTKDVSGYFSAYGPSWCEWLNDSSCNLVFEDAYTMRRALRGLSVGANESQLDVMEEDSDMNEGKNRETEDPQDKTKGESEANEDEDDEKIDMDTSGEEPPEDDIEWRLMKPWVRKGRTIPMWGRMATDKDVRPNRPNPKSKWSRTIRRQIMVDVEEDGYTFHTVKTTQGKRNPLLRKDQGVMRDGNSIQKSTHVRKTAKMDT